MAARIAGGRYEPLLVEATRSTSRRRADVRVAATGTRRDDQTDAPAVRRSLAALAVAAVRHGGVERVDLDGRGRELELAPVNAAAAPVVAGEELRDLGSIVAAG